jgi:hypothetical protein
MSNMIYTNVPGTYEYPDNEGCFKIFTKDNINYVHNMPAGNDSTYIHPNLNYPLEPATLCYDIGG